MQKFLLNFFTIDKGDTQAKVKDTKSKSRRFPSAGVPDQNASINSQMAKK